MFGAILAATLLLAEATPAAAPATVATPAVEATTDAKAGPVKVRRDDDLICKQQEVLGSRIPKKVCYTRAEQEARSQEDRKEVERMQSQFGKVSN